MDALFGIFSAFGLSASAGLNAYIPLLVVGIIARYTDWIKLTPPFDTLSNPWILALISILLVIEILADKIPVVHHINDIIQTIIRPIAGAIIFAASAQVMTGVHPVLALACGLLVAGTVHTVKSVAVRPMVSASTAGTANVPVSAAEDGIATALSILSIVIPVLAGILLILLIAMVIWWIWERSTRKRQERAKDRSQKIRK